MCPKCGSTEYTIKGMWLMCRECRISTLMSRLEILQLEDKRNKLDASKLQSIADHMEAHEPLVELAKFADSTLQKIDLSLFDNEPFEFVSKTEKAHEWPSEPPCQ